jgi:hypothetical protein
MSQHDLASGRRWSEQLSKELDQSNFGIVCLTPGNLQSPWILFEAGALTKHVEGRACCLLFRGLGPADVSGPLSQFQNRVFCREGFQKLLFDINDLLERRLDPTSLQLIYDKWWGDLDREVTAALADPQLEEPTEHKRDHSDLLEELLLRVRNIQRVMEHAFRDEPAVGVSRNSLRDSLNLVIGKLSPIQVSLLREFVAPAGIARRVDLREIGKTYSKADIEALVQFGLVAKVDEDSAVIVHDLLAKYLAEMLPSR